MPPRNVCQRSTTKEVLKRSRFVKSVPRRKFSRQSPSSSCDYRYTFRNKKLEAKKNILSNPIDKCVGAITAVGESMTGETFEYTDVLRSCNMYFKII